jgi:hypothetical protein
LASKIDLFIGRKVMVNRLLPFAVLCLRWLLTVLTACSIGLLPAVATAAPRAAVPAQADAAEWLIMLYSDADDNVLEEDILIDLQEAELVGSTDRVTIVAQTDRFQGGYDGMGDWTSAKRFLITQDDDMGSFGSEELADLGEVNMADGATLLDFIEWAVTTYPATKRMLILSDHGAGWPGGLSDPDPGGDGADDIALVDAFGDNLWLMELDRTLDQARTDLGLDYFDVIGFDACLMSQLEVYTALAPHALYSVASEETEPGLGWAYAGFLGQLVAHPEMEGDKLVQTIVTSYIDDDMRLEDPAYVGSLSRAQAAAAISPEVTLTAVDLARIAPLNAALDGFVVALQTLDQNAVAEARTYAQAYESIFGDELPSPYIDLGHFAQLIQSSTEDPAVLAAAQELDAARQAAIVAEKHGPERPGSTGIAIYFPVPELYEFQDNLGYTDVADRFTQATQWDEFLAFHAGDTPGESFARPAPPLTTMLQTLLPELAPEYTQVLADEIAAMIEQGLAAEEIAQILVDEYELPDEVVTALFDAGRLGAAPAPAVDASERKPLQVEPIRLSAEVAYPGAPVTVETEIAGERVGFVYSFIGRFLPEDDVVIVEDLDFLFAEEDTSVGGVTYPQWPEEGFTVGYDWEPVVYAISDGETAIRTLFAPESYGEQPTYTVEGLYAFADGSPERYARLFFRDGELAHVFGFIGANNDGTGAPREITPQPGDQFTVLTQGYNLADDAADAFYSAEGGTLTFGEEPFFIAETPAPSGNYVVGVIAEDLDGNQVEAYEGLFVVGEDGVTEEGFVPFVAEDLGFALLHPENWAPVAEDEPADRMVLTNADETALMTVSVFTYPDAADDAEANLAALDDVVTEFASGDGVENLAVAGDPADYLLGAYNALLLDFNFDAGDVAYAGEVVASTPTPGVTYVVIFVAPAEEAELLLLDLDAVLYSFDILISGIDRAEPGAAQPELAATTFMDGYSDPASGLYDDEVAAEWGMGYYDPEAEQYVYEVSPASGAIYDYYADLLLPDAFLLQATAQTAGAVDTGFGLIFQVQDDSHFYAFRVSGDGYFLVEKADGESLQTLVDWTPGDALDLTEEALNTLAVVGAEGVYGLYVNGVQVGEFADASYGAGSAGYMVENFDATVPAVFVFDDFVVGAPLD